MRRIKLDLDGETLDRLLDQAAAERRPPEWEAEVLLRKALGLQFPYPTPAKGASDEAGTDVG